MHMQLHFINNYRSEINSSADLEVAAGKTGDLVDPGVAVGNIAVVGHGLVPDLGNRKPDLRVAVNTVASGEAPVDNTGSDLDCAAGNNSDVLVLVLGPASAAPCPVQGPVHMTVTRSYCSVDYAPHHSSDSVAGVSTTRLHCYFHQTAFQRGCKDIHQQKGGGSHRRHRH